MILDTALIRTDGGTQPRAGIDPAHVERLRDAMDAGDVLPPLTVYHDGAEYWLADGFHRLAAHAADEHSEGVVPCDVRQGTRRDAVLYSVGANRGHGLPRSREDTRRAIERLIRDEEWGRWSDREIARQVGCHNETVASARKRLESSDGIRQSATRISGDGRERPAGQPSRSKNDRPPRTPEPPLPFEPDDPANDTPDDPAEAFAALGYNADAPDDEADEPLSAYESAVQRAYRAPELAEQPQDEPEPKLAYPSTPAPDVAHTEDEEIDQEELDDAAYSADVIKQMKELEAQDPEAVLYLAQRVPPIVKAMPVLPAAPPMAVHFSSATPEWYTPRHIVDAVIGLFGHIDLDPCSNAHGDEANVPARVHFTQADNGLAQSWRVAPWIDDHGEESTAVRVYMNPPYGDEIGPWIDRLIAAYENGEITEAVALLPARTDTAWFDKIVSYTLCLVRGRLRFIGAKDSAPFPSVIVYLGADIDLFCDAFGSIGNILELRRRYERS
jgi:hypothetical protein